MNLNGRIGYRENEVGRIWRTWQAEVHPYYGRNFAGDPTSIGSRFQLEGTLLNYWNGEIGVSRDLPHLNDRLTRGGPLARDPGQMSFDANVNSDQRKAYTLHADARYGHSARGGWSSSVGLNIGAKPVSSWSVDLQPRLSRGRNAAQYIGVVDDSLAVDTYGHRYLFAPIDQTTLSLTTRLNVTMRPTLTLAVVAQPFLASGRYGTPSELARARSYDFSVYGVDAGTLTRGSDGSSVIDPDGAGPARAFTLGDNSFNTRTVNGTAALRWEWRPGSAAYLVWQHHRSAPGTRGDFDFARDRSALFRATPENTIMLKVSYWINP